MRLKWLTPLGILALCLSWSSSTGGLKFTPIYDALVIKAQKNSPPHIAFEELIESERKNKSSWSDIEQRRPTSLSADPSHTSSAPLYAKKIELPEMVIAKNVEVLQATSQNVVSLPPENFSVASEGSSTSEVSQEWRNTLTTEQSRRLDEADRRSEVLAQDWSKGTSWSEMAKEVLERSGVLKESTPASKVYVAATNSQGQTQTRVPAAEVGVRDVNSESLVDAEAYRTAANLTTASANSFLNIQGPLEISGGLAVTNEHHIEVRRTDEGISKELGKVDLVQGIYNIQIEGASGSIVARLVNKDGKVLGEGAFRISQMLAQKTSKGPKIRITPQPDFSVVTASAYNPSVMEAAPPQTRVTFIKGVSETTAKKDGVVAMDNVAKGSSTIFRAAAPKHLQTASLIVSGEQFKASLFPESMIKALQEIVAQQRALVVSGAPTVVWGRASLDGKPIAGISVSVESDPSLQAVYFNSFMIPDPKLETTSENGLFAFVALNPGFHALLATRGDAIFGYQNVLVEEGSVAQGDIDATMKFESVPLRVYDAFTGEAREARITMQSLADELTVERGLSMVQLPQVNRLGMMRVQPDGADYVAARYLYNDKDSYLHVPLVHWSWLSAIKSFLKIDDHPSAGLIVGFVPDENFEVYLAAYDHFDPRQIVYFDMQGRILQNRKGIAGGGFILYNVPDDTHEVVVVGERTQKIYSRVVPVDPHSLSVLSFRE